MLAGEFLGTCIVSIRLTWCGRRVAEDVVQCADQEVDFLFGEDELLSDLEHSLG